MNKDPYLSSNQFDDLICLQEFAKGCGSIAKSCIDPQWRKWLKCADSLITKVIESRVQHLDQNTRDGLEKRVSKTDVVVVEKSLVCVLEHQKRTITLDWDDFMDVLEMAQWTCCRCPQGSKVKSCKFKKILLKSGIPVARENPQKGECPYRWDNEIHWFDPDGKEVKP